jgi:hypothetical protein
MTPRATTRQKNRAGRKRLLAQVPVDLTVYPNKLSGLSRASGSVHGPGSFPFLVIPGLLRRSIHHEGLARQAATKGPQEGLTAEAQVMRKNPKITKIANSA